MTTYFVYVDNCGRELARISPTWAQNASFDEITQWCRERLNNFASYSAIYVETIETTWRVGREELS